jgi:NAD(P)-dependent dehydrogenase (short-subunit alcohol dehydrogenase family)/uncharacterized protein YndB with AHSA1/START domain
VIAPGSGKVVAKTISLHGQVAVVTGGGRGIGRAIALALATAGTSTAVLARSQSELDETVQLIEHAGGRAQAFATGVTDVMAVRRAIAEIERSLGPVDLLVNNAATAGPIGPFWETDTDRWWQALEVNLRGPLHCSRAVLPGMVARRQGRIVNIASTSIPIPYFSSYATGKTALIRFTETVAAELAPHGVRIFALAPGTVRTAMSEYSLNSPEGRRWLPWFRRIFEEGLDIPAERPARMVVELASGRADKFSGRLLSVSDDLNLLLENKKEIEEDKLFSLRVRTLGGGSPALSAIRAAAECAPPLTLCVERKIEAPPEKVFRAWIDPEAVKKWFVHKATVHWTKNPEIDARADRHFSWSVASDDNDQEEFAFHGTYHEVEPGKKLAFTWEWQTLPIEGIDGPGMTLVTVEFLRQEDSTKVVLTQSGLPNQAARNAHDKGWNRCVDGISKLFSEPQ